MPLNAAGTYYYTPDIKAYVWSTVQGKPIDLSDDIIDFTINRAVNSTSTASISLANANWKYTPGRVENNWNEPTLINTMDRVVIFLKRESYLQVFSGYVTSAPIATLLPEPIVIQASCTLYKIQNTYWDVNVPAFQALMPGAYLTQNSKTETYQDGGAAQGIVNVLTKVVGWDANKIHVGALPPDWVNTNVDLSEGQKNLQGLLQAIDAAGIVAGQNLAGTNIDGTGEGKYVTYKSLDPELIQAVAIPNGVYTKASPPKSVVSGTVTHSHGENYRGIVVGEQLDVGDVITFYTGSDDPVNSELIDDDWWCVVPWPYSTGGFSQDVVDKAKKWLADDGYGGQTGRHIVLTSIANGHQVVVKATIAGDTGGGIVISPKAWKYLAGDPVETIANSSSPSTPYDFYLSNEIIVTANWAKEGKTRKGKQNTLDKIQNLRVKYGFQYEEDTLATQINPGNVVVTDTVKSTNVSVVPGSVGSAGPGKHSTTGRKLQTTTTTTTTSKLSKTLTTRRWAILCLQKAGFEVNDWNVQTILSWIGLENDSDTWDYRFNPLNCAFNTIESVDGPANTRRGAYASLEDAAQAWADVINPADGVTSFPEIRAAFSSKKFVRDTKVRDGIVKAAQWGVANKAQIFYDKIRPMPLTQQLPLTTDCSGFVTLCYYLAGAPDPNNSNYNRQGYTGTLLINGTKISKDQVQPGDIVVYGPDTGEHTSIIVKTDGQYANNFLVITQGNDAGPNYTTVNDEASFLPGPVQYLTFGMSKQYPSANRTNNPFTGEPWTNTRASLAQRRRILSQAIVSSNWSPNHYGGIPNQLVTAIPLRAGASSTAGQGTGKFKGSVSNSTINSGFTGTGSPNFNTSLMTSKTDDLTTQLMGSPRAFITDQPVLTSIASICKSSLRDFQSSPTGDFCAWFPDYFGVNGQAPVLNIYDIEIIDFQIYHDDTLLATHIGVAGDPFGQGTGVGLDDWMMTNGIVSIQIDQVMAQLFGLDINTLNSLYPPSFSQNFLARYGLRPKVQELPLIRSHALEFMYAWRLFEVSWAAQYTSQVQFTFLPELYPGMRIRLADHNLEVYVQSVTHQGSRTGGFTTTAQVTCPVTRDPNGEVKLLHFGFPYNKIRPTSKQAVVH